MRKLLALVGVALNFLTDDLRESTGRPVATDAEVMERIQLKAISERLTALNEGGYTALALRQALPIALEGHSRRRTRKGADAEANPRNGLEEILFDIVRIKSDGPDLCKWDPSLPTWDANTEHRETGQYMIALNMFNQAPLLPRIIRQILILLTKLPYEAAFVSIYESNSLDTTGDWLKVFQQLLQLFAYPHRVEQGGYKETLQRLNTRQQHAFHRNKALEPLWHFVAHMSTAGREDRPEGEGVSAYMPPQKILFINDVAFCARDAIRLLSHTADIACGLDFAHYENYSGVHFYDRGVARDADGSVFSPGYPFVKHPYSVRRMHKGLHFPVKCCWNGMAALNAAPFLRHGLHFRAPQPGECPASEVSLVCNDFLRLGYSNFVVDPGVRLAYDGGASRILYREHIVAAPATAWSDVLAVPIRGNSSAQQPLFQCCSGPQGALHSDAATPQEPCFWDNYLAPNYTDAIPRWRNLVGHQPARSEMRPEMVARVVTGPHALQPSSDTYIAKAMASCYKLFGA